MAKWIGMSGSNVRLMSGGMGWQRGRRKERLFYSISTEDRRGQKEGKKARRKEIKDWVYLTSMAGTVRSNSFILEDARSTALHSSR